MSKYLLISGAKERKNGFELGEGKYYDRAKLLRLDLASGSVETLLEKSEGGEHYPDEHPNLQYTACWLEGDTLWLPTDTEVYKLAYPSLTVELLISHPAFHNIHSVNVFDDKVYITSTGLDLVAVYTTQGELVEMINCQDKPLWHRFSENEDYRLVHSTRPHDCHPNFVFHWQGKPWVTRCKQQDAVMLGNTAQQIELTVPEKRISVHDGLVFKDKVYFTSVDGFLLIADPETGKLEQEINVLSHLGGEKLGWCRGLTISEDGIAYLGFSRIRRTKVVERLSWLVRGQLDKMTYVPACVLAYDIRAQKVVKQYDIPISEIDAVYGVIQSDA